MSEERTPEEIAGELEDTADRLEGDSKELEGHIEDARSVWEKRPETGEKDEPPPSSA